jgi:hypothetical protein
MPRPSLVLLAFLSVYAACSGGSSAPTPSASTDASLANLLLSSGALTPAFAPEVFDYTVVVAPAVVEFAVTPIPANEDASVAVNGVTLLPSTSALQTLTYGANEVTVVVTAPNGIQQRTYTLAVTRATIPELASLEITAGTLDPAFTPLTTGYSVAVAFLQPSIVVRPTAANAEATITVQGTPVASGEPSAPIALGEGVTAVIVRVNGLAGAFRDYVLTVTRASAAQFAQQAYVKASNTGGNDEFGYAIAVDGDVMAVGAYREDSSATGVGGNQGDNGAANSGAVYVFRRANGVWAQEAYVKASNSALGDFFGFSVAIAGDTLAVGAYLEDSAATGIGGNELDNSAPDSGAVYVFQRIGGVWGQQAYVKASNTDEGDGFGVSVALANDTLVVGAYLEDSAATGIGGDQQDDSAEDSGAAYVFTRAGGQWGQTAYVKASNTGEADQFGLRVALSGERFAASAMFEDSAATGVDGDQLSEAATNSGAVYLFAGSGSAWAQEAYVKAANTGAGDQFGIGIALAAETLAVGANQEDSGATGIDGDGFDDSAANSGAVYVFSTARGFWSQQAYVKASNTGIGDMFGIRVALAGDVLAVGASNEDSIATGVNGDQGDNGAANSGAAYVFVRNATMWTQAAYVKASNTGAGDLFGLRLALAGSTLVVGAPDEDSAATGIGGNQGSNGATNSGAVYVLR